MDFGFQTCFILRALDHELNISTCLRWTVLSGFYASLSGNLTCLKAINTVRNALSMLRKYCHCLHDIEGSFKLLKCFLSMQITKRYSIEWKVFFFSIKKHSSITGSLTPATIWLFKVHELKQCSFKSRRLQTKSSANLLLFMPVMSSSS